MMKEMLQAIIDMDKEARERVREAEAYRDDKIAGLSEQKNQITQEENQKALDFALRKSQKQRAEGDAYIKSVNERNQKITDEIDAVYREKEEQWVSTIVNNVIKN